MPFERFERNGRRPGQRTHYLRRFRVPIFAVVGVLVAFELFARSSITRGPQDASPKTNLGWQSFLPAYTYHQKPVSSLANSTSDDSLLPPQGQADYGSELDEWSDDNNAYAGFNTEDAEDYWNPFVLHRRPITEVTAKACIWPPSIYDACMPDSSMREDAERGKWMRIEKDLNMRVGIYYLYLFYRRLPYGSRADTIRDFKVVPVSRETTEHLSESEGWHMVSQDVRDGVWPRQETAHLYYRTAPRSDGNRSDEVNELDVVWGTSGALYGWHRMGQDFAEPREKNKAKDQDEGAELMWRKGTPVAPKAKLPLTFSTDGNFTILQIADLHFSVGKGKCLDSDWPGCNDPKGADLVTLDWLGSVLDEEKPDLVVLSGDQLNGRDTSYSSESVILKVAKLFENRKIPWTAVLGNHDSEKTTLTRYGQFVMMQALPYFVGEPGPLEVAGEGNYVMKIRSADESKTHLLTLYFLDSHAYVSGWNVFKSTYDYIKDNQINWYRQISQGIKPIERPFKPPVLEDSTFGNLEDDLSTANTIRRRPSRLEARQALATTLKKPNALAIFHIPLKEVYDMKPDVGSDGNALVVGSGQEERGAPKNGDFFSKGLLKQTEIGSENDAAGDAEFKAALTEALPEVKVILNGHCHTTDSCTRLKGIWSCFAGGSSYSGYSEKGFDRRVRVFRISDYGERISTYKILDTHADHSGESASSHGSQETTEVASEQADKTRRDAETSIANLLEMDSVRAARQLAGTHKKLDEVVLVGEGMLN